MRGQACYRKIAVMAKRSSVQGQQNYHERDHGNSNVPRNSHRFQLDIHPLETLYSIKTKVAAYCQCPISQVKPFSCTGRVSSNSTRSANGDTSTVALNVVPEESIVDELGLVQGCEMVFLLAERQQAQ
jgi:hypothetical protein